MKLLEMPLPQHGLAVEPPVTGLRFRNRQQGLLRVRSIWVGEGARTQPSTRVAGRDGQHHSLWRLHRLLGKR
jgi:hypothetical protein